MPAERGVEDEVEQRLAELAGIALEPPAGPPPAVVEPGTPPHRDPQQVPHLFDQELQDVTSDIAAPRR